ncbi:MAG: 2OG-Fe(II) oxygenase [Luteibaculaceae bacterium]
MPTTYQEIAEQIAENHFAIVDNFLDAGLIESLRLEMLQLYEQNEFHKAAVGKGESQTVVSEVRGDKIHWLDKKDCSASVKEYFEEISKLRSFLKEFFFLPLNDFEAHFAYYPKQSFYLKHYDQFRGSTNRLLSVVLYINSKWEPKDEGFLRIYKVDNQVEFEDFAPLPGRLAIFRSDTVLHEVLKTNVPRYSITGWLRNNPPEDPIYKLL